MTKHGGRRSIGDTMLGDLLQSGTEGAVVHIKVARADQWYDQPRDVKINFEAVVEFMHLAQVVPALEPIKTLLGPGFYGRPTSQVLQPAEIQEVLKTKDGQNQKPSLLLKRNHPSHLTTESAHTMLYCSYCSRSNTWPARRELVLKETWQLQ